MCIIRSWFNTNKFSFDCGFHYYKEKIEFVKCRNQVGIEYTSYNEEKNITTTTLKKVYSKDNIVNRLTNKNLGDEYLGDRLNSTINGANFEKQWDQLYRGGYVRSKTDDSLKYFGSISWDMVGKMRTLSYDDLVKQLEPQRNEFDSDKKFETASEQFKSFIKRKPI